MGQRQEHQRKRRDHTQCGDEHEPEEAEEEEERRHSNDATEEEDGASPLTRTKVLLSHAHKSKAVVQDTYTLRWLALLAPSVAWRCGGRSQGRGSREAECRLVRYKSVSGYATRRALCGGGGCGGGGGGCEVAASV